MFLLQILHSDGTITASMARVAHIVEQLGFRDCSGNEIRVFDVSNFGAAQLLEEVAVPEASPNYHRLINPETGRVVIEGYSAIH